MKIVRDPRIELGDLTSFIAKEKSLTYDQAENLIPAIYFEGGHIHKDDKEEWCKEITDYLKDNNIDHVEVFQD